MNQNHKIIIAIDGYSSSGKSTLAQEISKILKYTYIDTGAMYRSIALLAIQKNVFNSDLWNLTNFIPFLKNIDFQFQWNKILNRTDFLFNKKNVQSEIRSKEVTNKVSLIARIPEVREILTMKQRNFVKNIPHNNKGILIDGRDIGNIVFPQSKLKIFMTGSIEIRSYRRYKEIKKKGEFSSYEEIRKNILYRDMIDISRKISPLKKPIDSIEIDNTFLNTEKQLMLVLQLIKKNIIKNKKNHR